MGDGNFWDLFAETGEPLYWLLSRAEARASRETGRGEPDAGKAEPSDSAPKL